MPEPDPLPSNKTPWGSAPQPAGTGADVVPPFPVPDHTLIRRIGKGSYGEVWLGRNVLGVYRAVKIIHRSSFDHDRPFEREFDGMQRFEPVSRTHESQLNILQVGRGPGCFYYVMELADDMGRGTAIDEGSYTPRNLRSELLLRARLPVDECVRLGLALTTALGHLHRHGLVHRDIKPSNIVFVNGIPKLADIGLVALAESTMSFVGTEGYLPPEGPGTVQADVFSLGKVLYEISTGRDRQQFPELPTGITELPDRAALAELNEVLLRACAPDAKQRYESAAEMHADLALLQSGKSVTRMRAVERRLKAVARAGAVVTGLALLAGAAFFYQQVQTREARRLASENFALAGEKSRLAADKSKLAEENREQLVRLRVANGNRLLDEGDPSAALLWFAEALPLLTNRPAEEAIHRIRIQQALDKTPRLLQVFPHATNTAAMSFSPDGRRIATGSGGGGELHMWDTRTGEALMQPLAFDVDTIWQTRFTQDGQRIFVSSLRPSHFVASHNPTNIVAIIEIASSRQIVCLLATNLVRADFSPDERWIVTADSEHVIRVHDARDGKPISEFKGHTNGIHTFAFSANGNVLASASNDRTVRLWRLPSGASIGLPLQFARDQTITLSRDGRLLATGGTVSKAHTNSTVQTWDVETGAGLGSPIQLDGEIQTLVFVPPEDQRLCAVTDKEQGLFEAQSHKRLLPPISIERALSNWLFIPDAISPDGHHIALGGSKGLEGVWNLESGEREFPACHQGRTYALVEFSPDGSQLAAISDDGAGFLWDVRPRPEDSSHQFNANVEIRAPLRMRNRFSPDRRRFVIRLSDQTMRLVDTERLVEVDLPGSRSTNSAPHQVVFDGSSRQWAIAYAGSKEFLAELWREEAGVLRHFVLPHPHGIQTMCFSPDGTRLFTRNDETKVRTWRTSDGTLEQTIPLPEALGFGMILSDARTLLCANRDGDLVLFDLVTSATAPLEGAGSLAGEITIVASALDRSGDRFAAVTAEGWGRVWSTRTGKPLTPPIRSNGRLNWIDWSPDNRRILMSGAAPEVTVWDAATGEASLPPLRIGDRSIETAMWSLDGRFIVARSDENAARVWDAATGEAVTPLLKHSSYLGLALLVANNRLITFSLPNKLRAWDLKESTLPADVLADYAKLTAGRRLTSGAVMVPIPPAKLAELCRSLRARAPQLFE